MPTTTTPIRSTVKARLAVVMAAVVPSGVAVSRAYPGREEEREYVVGGETTGNLSIRTQRAGRKARDDEFVVEYWIRTAVDHSTAADAEDRAEAIFATIESGFADPTVIGPHLQGGTTWEAINGLVWALIDGYDGPDAVVSEGGWSAELRFEVRVLARLD